MWEVCPENEFNRKCNDTVMVRLDTELSYFYHFNIPPKYFQIILRSILIEIQIEQNRIFM